MKYLKVGYRCGISWWETGIIVEGLDVKVKPYLFPWESFLSGTTCTFNLMPGRFEYNKTLLFVMNDVINSKRNECVSWYTYRYTRDIFLIILLNIILYHCKSLFTIAVSVSLLTNFPIFNWHIWFFSNFSRKISFSDKLRFNNKTNWIPLKNTYTVILVFL